MEKAADIAALRHVLERAPKQLSSTRRQRVTLALALVRPTAVFLFDEPLSNTEGKLRDRLQREIACLHRRVGTTVVYVTHDQGRL